MKEKRLQLVKVFIGGMVAFLLILIACAPSLKNENSITIKAIYLTQDNGQLTKEDLQAHPEVMVTGKFDEFKNVAKSKVALWIDINSVGLVNVGWLSEHPQKYYPIVLIGNSKASCVFFGSLQYFLFEIPARPPGEEDYCNTITSGYSINILKSESSGNMHGYDETPTVQDIFDNTTFLLDSLK